MGKTYFALVVLLMCMLCDACSKTREEEYVDVKESLDITLPEVTVTYSDIIEDMWSYISSSDVLSSRFTKEDIKVRTTKNETVIYLANCLEAGWSEDEIMLYTITYDDSYEGDDIFALESLLREEN